MGGRETINEYGNQIIIGSTCERQRDNHDVIDIPQ